MTWGAEQWLWGLALPAFLLAWNAYRRVRQRRVRRMEKARYATAGMGGVRESTGRRVKPLQISLCLALALLAVSMAQPRWGSTRVTTFERSREVIIAIDVSRSMLADDLKPSRLDRAKVVTESMLDSLQGESVGLIVFAGTAFLQSPMSPDYQILRNFLREIHPGFIPQGGTNYRAMINTALDSFEQSDGMADRFLIVMSDGESLSDDWRAEAQKLKRQNVKAICLGFGTAQGSFIPDGQGGFHKDAQGAVVLTRLESATLRELASLTDGTYREASLWIDVGSLIEETVKRGQAELRERESEEFAIERYQYFLAPALVLLLLSIYREFPSLPKARTLKLETSA